MTDYFADILKDLLIGLPPAVVLLIVLLFFPEKIEKWSALLWKGISSLGGLFRSARKRAIKHDLQGRVNDYVRRLRKRVPGSFEDKLELEWVDANTQRSALLADGRVVLRLRAHDPNDHNFVHASYLYVSKCLLTKTKRYLSVPQRDALDIFVSSKLLKEEKPSVVGYFLDEYLHPKTRDTKSKVAVLIDDFGIIDQAGFFFPLLVQELEYLGDKVFGRRRDDLIAKELYDVVGFLRPLSQRTVGDEGDLNFDGSYTRFGVVLVGKPRKLLTSLQPYLNYIKRTLASKGVDTIYLIGRKENRDKIDQICFEFGTQYVCVRSVIMRRPLRYRDHIEHALQYLVVMRRKAGDLVTPSEKGTHKNVHCA
ncbi:MAG: hypothetical protein KAT34_15110 [Candidatus Aminicenantes bacterium]|nr:hypothetical protein [Candidatus Aminicenantes bacterium]